MQFSRNHRSWFPIHGDDAVLCKQCAGSVCIAFAIDDVADG
jgi:hypothetical protein